MFVFLVFVCVASRGRERTGICVCLTTAVYVVVRFSSRSLLLLFKEK